MVDTEAIADFAHEDALTLAVLYEAEKALTRSEVAERIELPEYKRQQAIYRLDKLSDRGFVIEHRPEGNHEAITYELNNFKGESYGEAAAQYTDFENPMDFDKRELLGRVQELSLELVETKREFEGRLEALEESLDEKIEEVNADLEKHKERSRSVEKAFNEFQHGEFVEIRSAMQTLAKEHGKEIMWCNVCESWDIEETPSLAEHWDRASYPGTYDEVHWSDNWIHDHCDVGSEFEFTCKLCGETVVETIPEGGLGNHWICRRCP
jgi:hypothetical protein